MTTDAQTATKTKKLPLLSSEAKWILFKQITKFLGWTVAIMIGVMIGLAMLVLPPNSRD